MRVVWALSAERDRIDIGDFSAQDNPMAAIGMDEVFTAAAVKEDTVRIPALVHTARTWPPRRA